MYEIIKYCIVNVFLITLKVIFLVPFITHHILFIKNKKKKIFEQSIVVRLLGRYPRIYECSILIWNFPLWKEIYKTIELKEGENLLQIGCGTGLFNKQSKVKLHIDNLDINERYLNYGRKKGRYQKFIIGSVYNLECSDAIYDTVLLARCFHHLKKQRKALCECVRVTKNNGRIIIYDPVSDYKDAFQTRYINTEFDGMIYDYHKESFVEYLKHILPENVEIEKIEFIKNFTVTNYNYKYPHTDAYIILRKKEKGNEKGNSNTSNGPMHD